MRILKPLVIIAVILVPLFLLVRYWYTDQSPESIDNYGKIVTQFHPALNESNALSAQSPTIFLLGGSEGGIWPGESSEVQELQHKGYNVVTVGYFGLPETPKHLSRIRLESFGEAIAQYKIHPKVNPQCLGMIGVSKGGELTLRLASLYPDIRLAVPIVPSNLAFQASNPSLFSHSSWTYEGKEVPYMPYNLLSWAAIKAIFSVFTGAEYYLQLHEEAIIYNQDKIAAAETAVENINGAVLLVSGLNDQYWPSSWLASQAFQRLQSKNFAFPYQHIAYDTDHDVLGFTPPLLSLPHVTEPKRLGETAWSVIMDFTQQHLGQQPQCKK